MTTSRMVTAHQNNLYVRTMAPTIYHFAALAKEQENPIIGFHLANSCKHMIHATHSTTDFFDKITETIARGAGKGAFSYVKHS